MVRRNIAFWREKYADAILGVNCMLDRISGKYGADTKCGRKKRIRCEVEIRRRGWRRKVMRSDGETMGLIEGGGEGRVKECEDGWIEYT